MRHLKPIATGHTHYGLGARNRRKAYYRGKYAREVFTTLLFIAFVAVCVVRFTG